MVKRAIRLNTSMKTFDRLYGRVQTKKREVRIAKDELENLLLDHSIMYSFILGERYEIEETK